MCDWRINKWQVRAGKYWVSFWCTAVSMYFLTFSVSPSHISTHTCLNKCNRKTNSGVLVFAGQKSQTVYWNWSTCSSIQCSLLSQLLKFIFFRMWSSHGPLMVLSSWPWHLWVLRGWGASVYLYPQECFVCLCFILTLRVVGQSNTHLCNALTLVKWLNGIQLMGLNQGLCHVSSLQRASGVARSMKGVTVFLHQNKQPVTLVEP